jgi:hypothetical protein
MAAITLDTANSTLTLNGRTIEDSPEGDVFTVAYQNDVSAQTQGTNGGVVVKERADKNAALLTVRVLRDSADDAYMTNLINQPDIEVLNGSLKTNFTRNGTDGVETYTLSNGTIQTRGDHTINNTDGEEVSEYGILFGSAIRSL